MFLMHQTISHINDQLMPFLYFLNYLFDFDFLHVYNYNIVCNNKNVIISYDHLIYLKKVGVVLFSTHSHDPC